MPRVERFFPSTSVSDWTGGAFGGGDTAPGATGTLSLTSPAGEDAFDEIDLSWSVGLSGSQAVTGYHIQKSTNGSSWSDIVADTSSVATTYTATGLSQNTQYWFRVAAINPVGEGDYGNEPNRTTSQAVAFSTSGSPTTRTYTSGGVGYKSLHWTSSGTFVPSTIPAGKTFDIWVVAGGAGGGAAGNSWFEPGTGGGGGGGAKTFTSQTLGTATHTITIGGGGNGGNANGGLYGMNGSNGSGSSFAISGGSTLSTTGGGYGSNGVNAGATGGSGGGGGAGSSWMSNSGGSATSGEGNAGGTGGTNSGSGGGGGGKGGAGSAGGSGTSANGGAGGAAGTNGYADGNTTVTGVGVWSGGGGGGAGRYGTSASGGQGAGGNGVGGQTAGSGTANSGGGGGGNQWQTGLGGSGGSGAVVIRWAVG